MFKMTGTQEKILCWMRIQNRYMNYAEVSRQFGFKSHSWAMRQLKPLLEEGYLTRNYSGKIKASKQKEGYSNDRRNAEKVQDKFLYEVRP